ncbi:MAG: SDR family NAD(P)-dependent oxidoreductase [Rhodospirillaceae bacterium]
MAPTPSRGPAKSCISNIRRPRASPVATENKHKVCVITGAARGIGLAVARRFLAEGWRVALVDIDGEGQARAAARSSTSAPSRALARRPFASLTARPRRR